MNEDALWFIVSIKLFFSTALPLLLYQRTQSNLLTHELTSTLYYQTLKKTENNMN